ncbi:hypothetical protein BGZ65_008549 [Modicella reniformis]|uniref:F-box domain-containing protein n=1 Tax=Modicella reniformis TaxID=1440133 RepID=A0A9P6SQ69_9FUNG|nr:hypothetical protein BGZ65_008549 [Modicella reniformis]
MEAPQLPPASNAPRKSPTLENLPLECIQAVLENLSMDCHALYTMLLMNKTWFQMVIPFLYRSPMALIDATWPKLSPYSQVLKKEPSPPPPSPSLSLAEPQLPTTSDEARSRPQSTALAPEVSTDVSIRPGRSPINTRRTSTASSNGGGGAGGAGGFGTGYAPRTQSRSSSHSSTRSWAGDAFHHGRNDAVLQKDQRERLIKRKKMQVLWVLLNCTLDEEEHKARMFMTTSTSAVPGDGGGGDVGHYGHAKDEQMYSRIIASSSLLSLDINPELDIEMEYFKPMVDYLSFYTHYYHLGLRYIIWKLFPSIDDAFGIEWRLICHCPEKIRELFLESVQLQDMIPLIPKLETLHRIKACHESWDVPGSIEFMSQHNQRFGTVQMLELEAYLPDKHDTTMDDNFSDLIAQVDRLKVLELAGFESLRARLELIPRRDLRVLRINCGTLSSDYSFNRAISNANNGNGSGGSADTVVDEEDRMSISKFLSQCRQLEELLLDPVEENMFEWAVQERRAFQAGVLHSVPNSPSPSMALANEPPPSLVPLKVLELSGTDSEQVAMTISQAAEAFQDTLEVIKANSFSYKNNRTLMSLSWRWPMSKLRVLKIVGRSNFPFDFRSLQYCPTLRILDLSKYSGMRGCSETLLLNLKYLTQLEYLGLSSFDHLTDSTLRTILGCMPKLKHLRLAIGDSNTSSTLVSNSLSSSVSGGVRGSSILASGTPNSGLVGSNSNSNSNGGAGTDMLNRLSFASLSLNASAASSSVSTQQQQPVSQSSHALPPPPPQVSTSMSMSASYSSLYGIGSGSSSNLISSSSSSVGGIGIGDLASSARSTSSLMDRFHLENNYLSLEGILDAIDELSDSDSKCQLEKLSIVLGKLDFEEHYRRLELYNQQHQDLEITVYRYAHAV